MQTGEWLKLGPLNTIEYSIKMPDGQLRKGFLRFTKGQQEALSVLKDQEEKAKNLDYAFVMLNPDPQKPEFTIEEIENSIDLDQIGFALHVWFDKKVANPRPSPLLDPKFCG